MTGASKGPVAVHAPVSPRRGVANGHESSGPQRPPVRRPRAESGAEGSSEWRPRRSNTERKLGGWIRTRDLQSRKYALSPPLHPGKRVLKPAAGAVYEPPTVQRPHARIIINSSHLLPSATCLTKNW